MPAETSGQLVLQPHKPPSARGKRTVQIEIHSRDRNYTNNVLSNPFKFYFQTPLKDVTNIELIGGTIPAYPHNITQFNNKFTFFEGGSQMPSICSHIPCKCCQIPHICPETPHTCMHTPHICSQTCGCGHYQSKFRGEEFTDSKRRTITIVPGYYTTEALLLVLPGLLNEGSSSTYSVCINEFGYLSITQLGVQQTFGFEFVSGVQTDLLDRNNGSLLQINTPATLLGFDLADYYSVPGVMNTLLSPYPIDLSSVNSRLYLYLDADNMQNLGCVERGSGRRSPFAIIYLDTITNGYKFLNKETVSPVSYSTLQPFSRLQTLIVDFRDEFYRPIHFNGKDFTLLLEFTILV